MVFGISLGERTMEKLIFSLDDRHIETLETIIAQSKYGTDRSKVLRYILDDFFRREGFDGY